MLKEEYSEGLRNLEKVAELRDQCLSLAWKQDANELRKSKYAFLYYLHYRL